MDEVEILKQYLNYKQIFEQAESAYCTKQISLNDFNTILLYLTNEINKLMQNNKATIENDRKLFNKFLTLTTEIESSVKTSNAGV